MKKNMTGEIYKALYLNTPANYESGSPYHRIAKKLSRLRKGLTFYFETNNLSLSDEEHLRILFYYLLKIPDDYELPPKKSYCKFIKCCIPYPPNKKPYIYETKPSKTKRKSSYNAYITLNGMCLFLSFFSKTNDENVLDSPKDYFLSAEQIEKINELESLCIKDLQTENLYTGDPLAEDTYAKSIFKKFIQIMTKQNVE